MANIKKAIFVALTLVVSGCASATAQRAADYREYSYRSSYNVMLCITEESAINRIPIYLVKTERESYIFNVGLSGSHLSTIVIKKLQPEKTIIENYVTKDIFKKMAFRKNTVNNILDKCAKG